MWNSHITKYLSAYCHNELDDEKAAQVKAHLANCARCQNDLEQVKSGIAFAQHLQISAAPQTIWPAIAANLHEEKLAPQKIFPWRLVLTSAVVLCVVIVGWNLFFRKNKISSGSENIAQKRPAIKANDWEITRIAGAPNIGNTKINDTEKLGVGEWLETDQASRAKLKIADIGYVNIDPNSRVKLVKTQSDEHRIELEKGKLSAMILAPPRLFVVDTPSATAVDLGCAYTLEVDEAGNSLLHVTSGWVSFVLYDHESFIPAGAVCATRKGLGVGTPYYSDATPAFIELLTKIDFDKTIAIADAVNYLLPQAREKDGLTLWHLLQRSDWDERLRSAIFDRLAKLQPPPKGVTRTGILQQDRKMLEQWWEEWMY